MRNFKQIGEAQLCVTEDMIPFQGDHDSWFKENSYKEGMIISYTAFLSWFTKEKNPAQQSNANNQGSLNYTSKGINL